MKLDLSILSLYFNHFRDICIFLCIVPKICNLPSVLNVKAVVAAFNQEKALVGAFSVIVKTGCGTDGSFYSTSAVCVQ